MSARVVNAIPPTNTSLAGFAFGAMYPLLAPVLLLVPVHRGRCELLHTSLVVQKMIGHSKATCDGDHSYRTGSALSPCPLAEQGLNRDLDSTSGLQSFGCHLGTAFGPNITLSRLSASIRA